jgi:hypothetical protein
LHVPPSPHKRDKVFEVETLGLDFGVDPGLHGNRKAPAGGRGLISISIIADAEGSSGQLHLIDYKKDRLFLGLTACFGGKSEQSRLIQYFQ